MVSAGSFRSDLFFRISVVSAVCRRCARAATILVLLAQQILADSGPAPLGTRRGLAPGSVAHTHTSLIA